ncbi:MAG TPA: HIT family protein [Burkholderiaceae bacterium]|nr:HIT family protein [Burkholderiaceae bacterium]
MNSTTCELCSAAGGRLIFDDGRARVVAIDEPEYPGFIRVIWNMHVREITDLSADDRMHLLRLVFAVEQAQRSVLTPDKMNVASLGNMTPHLHWHLIPRYADDAHFPGPIWSEQRRATPPVSLALRRARLPELEQAIIQALRLRDA